MTAILQPGSTTTGGGGGVANAINEHGTAAAVPPGAIVTLCSFTSGTRKLRGFQVHGSTDCEAWLEIDGTPLAGMRARFSRVLPAYLPLPNPELYPSGVAAVRLRMQNTGPVTGDFEGVVFGE